MATSTKILLTTEEKPAFFVAPLRKDSAEKVSELLQENHDKHHAYFNNDGFHVSSPQLPFHLHSPSRVSQTRHHSILSLPSSQSIKQSSNPC